MVKFKWLVVLGLFLMAVQPSFGNDREKLVGVWKLVSWEWEVQATGARLPSMGKNPTGYRVFTPEGRMMQIVTAEGRKAPNTEKERAALFDSMAASTGMYRVEGDKYILAIDVAWHPMDVGREVLSSFTFEGNRLQIIGDWMPSMRAGVPGRMGRIITTWERAKQRLTPKTEGNLILALMGIYNENRIASPTYPVAVVADRAPLRTKASNYPEPAALRVAKELKNLH